MTHTAIIQGRNMINCFTGRDDAVMAGCAVADNTHMVKRYLGKDNGAGVADRTILCGWQMISGKSGTDDAIVTGCTVADDAGMIIHTGGKGARGMTNTAILRGGHVVD